MKTLSRSLGVLLILSLIACQGENPGLSNPPRAPIPKVNRPMALQSEQGLSVPFDPKVDILMVIDDSDSMSAHVKGLSKNINRFVEQFAKVKAIDFHIGYTHVHDRIRYVPSDVPERCGPDTDAPNRLNWEAPGTLKEFTKGPAESLKALNGRRYLTRNDDFSGILKANLDPAVNDRIIKKYIPKDPKKPRQCPQGAENEESFTPILSALEVPLTPNAGFRRPGAFFVAIIISDAKDESVIDDNLTPNEFIRRLSIDTGEAKGNKKLFRVYAVAVTPGTIVGLAKNGFYQPDPAFAELLPPNGDGHTHYKWEPRGRAVGEDENPLVVAARLTQDASARKDSQALSIAGDNYGDALGEFGNQIQRDTLTNIIAPLPYHPQTFDKSDPEYAKKSLKVYLGENPNNPLDENQWKYNTNDNSVTIYGQAIDWKVHANDKIHISYTPVDDTLSTTKAVPLK